ncbi:MAG: AAA family ATPase [Thermomicrobium sp.]|nr:AAA family ATPase [Thermomicrobium sp.]MDW8006032.1 AAA family ATPase [Thermomicrobium sp.]
MCDHYRLAMTESFGRSLAGLPRKIQELIWRRLPELRADPHPDGSNNKMRLEQYPDVYRWRVNEYRVFYRIDPECLVILLSIEHRKDAYRQDALPLGKGYIIIREPHDEDLALHQAAPAPENESLAEPPERPLQRPFTKPELERLGVPPEFHDALLACRTEDELLEIAERLPDERLTRRVLDLACGVELDELLDEAIYSFDESRPVQDLLTGRARLELVFDDSQREVLQAIATQEGPFVITGAAGTGKTLVAIRALEEFACKIDDADARFLFVTYTRTLAEFARQMIRSSLSPQTRFRTEVKTLDALVTELCPDIPQGNVLRDLQARPWVQTARVQAFERPLSPDPQRDRQLAGSLRRITPEYLLDEITEVIIGRGLTCLDEYLVADRTGRRLPLQRIQREAIWMLYETLTDRLRAENLFLHEELRQLALDRIRNDPEIRRYHVVVVDEVQDLSPVAVRLLQALCLDPGRFVLVGDEAQSIYLRCFGWQLIVQELERGDALDVRARRQVVRLSLRTSHRCPPEIAAAVRAYRNAVPDTTTRTEPPLDRKRSGRHRPLVLTLARWETWQTVLPEELRRLRQEQRLPWDHCAVLVPRNQDAHAVDAALRHAQIPTERVGRGQKLSTQPTVKILTWHNAKGLEFPAVFVLFPDWEPPPAGFSDPPIDEVEESIRLWRRAAVVALSRATQHLVVLRPAVGRSALLSGLESDAWEIRSVELPETGEPDVDGVDLPF